MTAAEKQKSLRQLLTAILAWAPLNALLLLSHPASKVIP